MKTDLLHLFEKFPYFTLESFKQATGMESPHQVRVLLHRWGQSGQILQLKRGIYMTRRFYDRYQTDPMFSAVVSAILLPQSYLSLEFILQEHNLLTEITHPITAITTRNTRRINNPIGTFWYRHIREDLYHGFTIEEHFGVRVARASPAKAIFDYLYLRPQPAGVRDSAYDLAEELRLNFDELSPADWKEFTGFVEESGSLKMKAVLENFRRNIWHS